MLMSDCWRRFYQHFVYYGLRADSICDIASNYFT